MPSDTPVMRRRAMTEPMYSTDPEAGAGESPGDFTDDQDPQDREPRPGNAPAPGQRPSESGSTSSDIPTEADADEHRDHAPGLRRERHDRG